jgi:hypothetical protein
LIVSSDQIQGLISSWGNNGTSWTLSLTWSF